MQKKLIALAIAGLSAAPVLAQTNVTVYGVADLSVESVKASGATEFTPGTDPGNATKLRRTRVTSNSSLIGFRGTEDLGNGLKAIFQFETGVNPDSTGGTLVSRDSFVGATGGFGTVVLGNLTHPIRNMGAKVDFSPGATGIGFAGAMYEEVLGLRTGTGDRSPNTIAYVTPSFGGFTATGAYIASSPNSNTQESRLAGTAARAERQPYQWQIAAQFESGPIYAGLGYHVANDPLLHGAVLGQLTGSGFTPVVAPTTAGEDELKVIRAAGKYTFPSNTTVSALWDRQKYEADGFGAASGFEAKRDAWQVGVNQGFGPHNVYLMYSRANKLKGGVCGLASATAIGACDDTKARMFSLGYNYSLSKRTMIKAYYADIRNDSRANYDFYTASVANNGLAPGTLPFGSDPRGFGVGLRHLF
jgi:predicted porin